MKRIRVGVLAFQGSVAEHIETTRLSAKKIKLAVEVIEVRTKESLRGLDALIIPGGESTTLYKLCSEAGMWQDMKKIRNIFGTCAGAIMLSKEVHAICNGQQTLKLMDIGIDRNAYGSQINSFSKVLSTKLGKLQSVFIRAPKIKKVGVGVETLAVIDREVYACEQKDGNKYFLATCFHPEFTSTLFHEHFLEKVRRSITLPPK